MNFIQAANWLVANKNNCVHFEEYVFDTITYLVQDQDLNSVLKIL